MAPEWREPDQTFRPKDLIEALPEEIQQRLTGTLDECFEDLCKENQGGGVTVQMVVTRFIARHVEFSVKCSALLGTHVLTLFLLGALDSAADSGAIDRVPASSATIQ
ncbi:hypothetical protein [uncultured Paludibaculum sp.]|uniref:hypothetical protein n=1 Tax=uncultured Paludibaculum sp. TaxID=1765020 RepID=UPI002AABFD77|nr:hypothetical protein [uncultured Paludibaculum sp.]